MEANVILRNQIFEIIKKINKEQGTTILLVEQNAHMALSIANRAYVLETGEIIKEGSGKELLADEDIKKAYLFKIKNGQALPIDLSNIITV